MINLRNALRMMRLSPAFAAVATTTLALGIGTATATFTVVDGMVLKSMHYPDAARIVAVDTKFTDKWKAIWSITGRDMEDLRTDEDSFDAFSFYNGDEMGVQLAKTSEVCTVPEFFRVFVISLVARG